MWAPHLALIIPLLNTVVPAPTTVVAGDGNELVIGRSTRVESDHALRAVDLTREYIKTLPAGGRGTTIRFEQNPSLPIEGYTYRSSESNVIIGYSSPKGAFYGLQTLKSLGERSNCLTIEDSPRFSYRGMHIDVSRHMFSVGEIKKFLDWMAFYKFNTFHWHLTDDGGWRMEVKAFPKLTSVGAIREDMNGSEPGGGWDFSKIRFTKTGYGGFYTQNQIRDIVKYAAERYITVIPEIEIPGHSLASIAAYPELGCSNQPASGIPGRPDTHVYCAGKETTFQFLEKVLDETLDLFPSKIIHIGGDEVEKHYWQRCPDCLARMVVEGLKTPEELQSYVIKRIERYVESKGRRIIGWDEILEGGLAPKAAVMSWRGIEGGLVAARQQHDVVMSPTSHCYFDYPYSNISTEKAYEFDPIPAELEPEFHKYVLGGQANLWTEWIPTYQRLEQMAFPRMLATSEALWSHTKNWNHFEQRLRYEINRLDRAGVHYMVPEPKPEYTVYLLELIGSPNFDASQTGFKLVYEEGDKAPSAKSKVWNPRLVFRQPTKLMFANLSSGGSVSQPVSVEFVNSQRRGLEGLAAGANVALYKEYENNSVNDLLKLTPSESWVQAGIGLDPKCPAEFFGLKFEGYIFAPLDGDYTFRLTCDDGAKLFINGALLVNNDGLHGAVMKSGKIKLKQGAYPMTLWYFQSGGAKSLKLTAQYNAGPMGEIPPQALLHLP